MSKCIVVFKSRTQAMIFVDVMRQMGLYAKSVSTPKESKIGCGLSAEINCADKSSATEVIRNRRLNSFYSFLVIEKRGNRVTTTKI